MGRRKIFVVGLPRTGTKLVADILQRSLSVHCRISPENFFLGHFIRSGVRHRLRNYGDLSKDQNVERLIDDMYAGLFRGTYWKLLHTGQLGIERSTLQDAILASDRSEKGIYEALMEAHPGITVDSITGDKNPGHLYHVPLLMSWFPQAKVIHTFRDPRAILVSEWRKRAPINRRNPFSLSLREIHSLLIICHVTVTWLYAVRLHKRHRRAYPDNYYLIKFEDLVSNPEQSIRDLLRFVEIEFDASMLIPRRFDSSFEHAADSRQGGGFDAETLNRWRDHIKPWMNRWLTFWGGKHLREFGYIT